MTVFGFNNRRDAENLSHFSKTMNFERGRKIGAPEGHETILVKAPSDALVPKLRVNAQVLSASLFTSPKMVRSLTTQKRLRSGTLLRKMLRQMLTSVAFGFGKVGSLMEE